LQPNVVGLIVAYAFEVPEERLQRREGAIPWDLEEGIFLVCYNLLFLLDLKNVNDLVCLRHRRKRTLFAFSFSESYTFAFQMLVHYKVV
jgi:hypothetical protein